MISGNLRLLHCNIFTAADSEVILEWFLCFRYQVIFGLASDTVSLTLTLGPVFGPVLGSCVTLARRLFLGICTKLISIKFCNRTMKEILECKIMMKSIRQNHTETETDDWPFISKLSKTLEFQSPWLSLNLTGPDCK